MLPLVTIVTPTFNQAKFIAETIDSVIAQSYPSIEYIVMNDGSTDNTDQILKSFENKITIIRHANIGQAATLNKGWELASGIYIGYLSSDDLLDPHCVASMVDILSDPSTVCAFPNSDLIDASSRTIKRAVCKPFSLIDLVVRQECHIGPGALFRKDAFNRVGGWRPDLRLAPDREFWMRLASQGGIKFDSRSLAKYRLHTESISYNETSDEVSREYLRVLDSYYEKNPSPELLTHKDEAYGRAHLILARNALRSGRWRDGLRYFRRARQLWPPLGSLSVRLTLGRSVVGKPIRAILGATLSVLSNGRSGRAR